MKTTHVRQHTRTQYVSDPASIAKLEYIERNYKKQPKKATACPYCGEQIENDDEYNEHLITQHPDEFDVEV